MIPISKILSNISTLLSKLGSSIITYGCQTIFTSNTATNPLKTCEEQHGTIILILILFSSLILGFMMLLLRDTFFGCEIGEIHHVNMKQKYVDMGEDNLACLRRDPSMPIT